MIALKSPAPRFRSRRRVITATAAAVCFPAYGATPVRAVIGFLSTSSESRLRVDAFLSAMLQRGYRKGSSLAITWRLARGDAGQLDAMADELVRLPGLSVLVGSGTPAVRVLRLRTSTIPIVMVNIGDPVRAELVSSLARPGANLTGLTNLAGDLMSKLVEYLLKVKPAARRFGLLWNPTNSANAAAVEMRLRESPVELVPLPVSEPQHLKRAFDLAVRQQVAGITHLADLFLLASARDVARLALEARLPSAFHSSEFVLEGGLLSYGASPEAQGERLAWYVDRVLQGAPPGQMPIEQVSTLELALNMTTAAALGLKFPDELAISATRIVRS